MKKALSRKNLWDQLPPSAKATIGTALRVIPAAYILGSRLRGNLRFLEAAQWWSREETRVYQLSELRRITSIASQTAFYRRTFDAAGFAPDAMTDVRDLARLPLTDRDTLRQHLTDMMTVSPRAAGVDFVSTGGTSGQPLQFYIGANRSDIEYAYIAAGWRRAGFTVGDTLAVCRGRVVRPDRNGLHHEHDPLLRHHYYSNFHMTDESVGRYLEHIAGLGPCFLHVYPSSADAFASFMRRSGMRPPSNIRGLLAESEIAYPEQRRAIEDAFKCRMFAGYGLTEKVVAAAECEHSTDYHVWPTYGFFELVNAEGRVITTPGERGEIVGTGFINTVVPFIRYRTGDFATFVSDGCAACGRAHPVIADIRGHRTQELLEAEEGNYISWTAINMHDDTFDRVARFQFYQEVPGRAVLRIVPAPGFSSVDQHRIRRRLEGKLGGRIVLTFEIVADIPRAASGKAIYVDRRIAGTAAREAGAEHPDAGQEPVTIGSAH